MDYGTYTRWEIRAFNHTIGDYEIREIDLEKYDTIDGTPDPEMPKPNSTKEDHYHPLDVMMEEQDLNDIFDVAFFYTPELLLQEGSVAAVEARIDAGVALSNLVYSNSGIELRMRKVSSELVAPTSTGPFEEPGGVTAPLLDSLAFEDGILDAEMAAADIVGADAAVLFVSNKNPPPGVPRYRGLAFINTDLINSQPRFYTSVLKHEDSIVHEIGHNMGVSALFLSVLCAMCYVLCVMCYVLCAMCYMPCAMCYVLCAMCYVLCAMCYVLCVLCFLILYTMYTYTFRLITTPRALMDFLVQQEPAMAIVTTPRRQQILGEIANDQSWHTVPALLPEVELSVPENPISQTLM